MTNPADKKYLRIEADVSDLDGTTLDEAIKIITEAFKAVDLPQATLRINDFGAYVTATRLETDEEWKARMKYDRRERASVLRRRLVALRGDLDDLEHSIDSRRNDLRKSIDKITEEIDELEKGYE